MNKNGKFTRKDISSAGFFEHSEGVWKKGPPDSPLHDPPAQTDKLERDPEKRTKKAARPKKDGKEINSTGYVYQLVIISYRSLPLDASNCSGKYIEDALVNAKFMPDDNLFFCPKGPVVHQIIGVPVSERRTEVFLFRNKR